MLCFHDMINRFCTNQFTQFMQTNFLIIIGLPNCFEIDIAELPHNFFCTISWRSSLAFFLFFPFFFILPFELRFQAIIFLPRDQSCPYGSHETGVGADLKVHRQFSDALQFGEIILCASCMNTVDGIKIFPARSSDHFSSLSSVLCFFRRCPNS